MNKKQIIITSMLFVFVASGALLLTSFLVFSDSEIENDPTSISAHDTRPTPAQSRPPAFSPAPTDEISLVWDLEEVVLWEIDFETGDFSQLENVGELVSQQNGDHSIVQTPVHSGEYAALLEIDEQGTDSAYLFFYNAAPNEPLPESFYLSAWIFLGAETCSAHWWNTMQFKSSPDGDSNNSDPVFSLDIRNHEIGNCESPLEYVVFSKPPAPVAIHHQPDPRPVPVAEWFHIRVYYHRDPDCGQIKVWQDAIEIFHLNCVPTVYPNDTLYPSFNNYADGLSNLYYLDDIILSAGRIDP